MSTTNDRSSSTTSAWEWRKVRRPPKALRDSAAERHRWRRFRRRNPREPITVQVWLRGGPEAWVAIRGRGEENYYPGHTAIYDILSDLCQLDKSADWKPPRGKLGSL